MEDRRRPVWTKSWTKSLNRLFEKCAAGLAGVERPQFRGAGSASGARKSSKKRFSQLAAICLLPLLAAVAGCHWCGGRRSCNDITPGAIPQPNGTYSSQWVNEQADRAQQDQFVIYQYEWAADGVSLTPHGQEHVLQIAQRLPQASWPITIEPGDSPQANESRRKAVCETLAKAGCPVDYEQIVFGRSEAEGLYGTEADAVSRGMLGGKSGQDANAGQFSRSSLTSGQGTTSGAGGFGAAGVGLY